MLGYIPPVYLPSTGGYNSQSGTRKSYRQALALGGLQSLLVRGLWSQKPAVSPWLCHQELVKAAIFRGRDVWQPRSARSLPCPLSWRLGSAPWSSRAGQGTPFPALHPKNLHLPLQGARASPASLGTRAGRRRRPRGKARSTRQGWEQRSSFGAASPGQPAWPYVSSSQRQSCF